MASLCVSSTFTHLSLFGAEFLSVQANWYPSFNRTVEVPIYGAIPITAKSPFCQVTVTYTHPGQDDNLKVDVFLPAPDKWNKILKALGGGGYVAGGTASYGIAPMISASDSGYAASTRDGGFGTAQNASAWALLSKGNLNLYNLQNLASVSLDDEAVISKSIVKDFYGTPPRYSYWEGCSQGGRQGLYLAQSNPSAYDGILAQAPAINFHSFFMQMYWPQLVMNLAGKYPRGCELDAIKAAAIAKCDHLDGSVDGVIWDETKCFFNPFDVIGQTFNCSDTGKNMKVSKIAAQVAQASWTGPRTTNGEFLWYGVGYGADLSGSMVTKGVVMAATDCNTNGHCTGLPFYLPVQWIALFLKKNPDFDLEHMTQKQFDDIFHYGYQRYHSFIDTDDPDLSRFKALGGKMITWHGTDDQVIPWKGTEKYYHAVMALDPAVHTFYRVFEAPGVQHCQSGVGSQPNTAFDSLRQWVENGIAPEILPVSHKGLDGSTFNHILCPYPKKSVYKGSGDRKLAGSYNCK